MKLTTSVLAVLLMISTLGLKAQDEEQSKLSISAGGGVGLSWFKSKNSTFKNNGVSLSYKYAMNVDYNFAKNYTFRTGVGMNYLGGKLAYDTNSIEIERKYRLQYLDIPLHMVLKTNQIGYLTYSLSFGLNNQMRISAMGEEEYVNGAGQKITTSDIDFSKSVRFYNLGFHFGIGADYEISNSFAAFGIISYNTGLTNYLSGTYIANNTINENAIINNLGLTLGFVF